MEHPIFTMFQTEVYIILIRIFLNHSSIPHVILFVRLVTTFFFYLFNIWQL